MKYIKRFLLLFVIVFIILVLLLLFIEISICGGSAEEAKRDTVCLKMNEIKKRIEMYHLEYEAYPSQEEGFLALITKNEDGKSYLRTIPKDSWATPFEYIKTKDGFELLSLGEDRKKGTEDDIDFAYCDRY